jgi:hypothetical protein
MRNPVALIALTAMLITAGCSDTGPESAEDASSLPEAQNAPVDQDPTPDTGTGGQQQTADPEATVK